MSALPILSLTLLSMIRPSDHCIRTSSGNGLPARDQRAVISIIPYRQRQAKVGAQTSRASPNLFPSTTRLGGTRNHEAVHEKQNSEPLRRVSFSTAPTASVGAPACASMRPAIVVLVA